MVFNSVENDEETSLNELRSCLTDIFDYLGAWCAGYLQYLGDVIPKEPGVEKVASFLLLSKKYLMSGPVFLPLLIFNLSFNLRYTI